MSKELAAHRARIDALDAIALDFEGKRKEAESALHRGHIDMQQAYAEYQMACNAAIAERDAKLPDARASDMAVLAETGKDGGRVLAVDQRHNALMDALRKAFDAKRKPIADAMELALSAIDRITAAHHKACDDASADFDAKVLTARHEDRADKLAAKAKAEAERAAHHKALSIEKPTTIVQSKPPASLASQITKIVRGLRPQRTAAQPSGAVTTERKFTSR